MKRVLFVDDEKNVLNGLRRMLRSIRDEWEMDFAPGGAEALELVGKKEYDLVVSDMRMPGMDGAELLTKVQELSPETVRIVLSGHSEQNMVMKSVKPAHQFLSKPCSSEQLLQTLKEAYRLRRLLNNPRIKLRYQVSRRSQACLTSITG
ncbi:response regulator [Salidesulfovibrio brasiliensis]|uniref:response regulator n=1 Tax=Salidesulfovibrio brasiliensis TaxID=221711 RepID=UPI0006D2461F|nr:response regulator [Salidesulfovibrio brasiliensis]